MNMLMNRTNIDGNRGLFTNNVTIMVATPTAANTHINEV